MPNITINNLPVIQARIQVPRLGAWTGDVIVDAQTAAQVPNGAAISLSIADGDLVFRGTSYRADAYAQTVTLRVVGGTNGLAANCKARFYNGAAIRIPLNDLMTDAGETLSNSSDQGALGITLGMWAMLVQPISLALSSLAEAAGASCLWRVLPDGSIFFGADSYPTSDLSDYELIDYAPQEAMQVIAAEIPNVFPGQTFASRKVSAVEHLAGDSMRTRVWFESP